MIDHIAPIYRTLIYEFLQPDDLSRLGETCRTIYHDKNREKMIINKISSIFGYRIDKYYDIKSRTFTTMSPNLFHPILEEFKKRTLSVKFSDIENLSFEEKRDLIITLPIDLFSLLDTQSQKAIVRTLCHQIYEMREYAVRNGMNMGIYDYRCKEEFDLYPFYQFVLGTLSRIFKESKNKIRCSVLKEWMEMDGKKLVPHGSIDDFLSSLFEGDMSQLRLMIEIGLFLKRYFPKYLKEYLESCFDGYMYIAHYDDDNDVDNSEDVMYDIYAQEVDEILDEKNALCPSMRNVEVLDRLLLECHLFSASLLRDANNFRRERYLKQNNMK